MLVKLLFKPKIAVGVLACCFGGWGVTPKGRTEQRNKCIQMSLIYMGYKIMVHGSSLVIVNLQEFSGKKIQQAAGAFFETSNPPASWSSRGLQLCEATQPTFKVGHFRKLNAPWRPSRFKYLQASASFF